MGNIILLLDKIETSLHKLNHPCVHHLNPGISSQKFQALFEKTPFQSNQELCSLYSWRNGLGDSKDATLGELAFFPGFYLMSLEESIQTYMGLRATDAWDYSWFPIFASGGGDFYAMNLAPEAQGEMIGFYMYEEAPSVEYNSLESMLKTFDECYKEGIIFKNSEGYLDMDYYKHAEIAHRNNPSLNIWNNILSEKCILGNV